MQREPTGELPRCPARGGGAQARNLPTGVVAAQEKLVLHQKRAGTLVREQPDVGSIRWVLDKDWYRDRGIFLN